jgi:hypothetical protein
MEGSLGSMSSAIEQSIVLMEKAGPGYYGLCALLAAVKIVGVSLMLTLRRLGFHLYTGAQAIMLFLPMMFGIVKCPDLFGTLITALFVWLYAREVKIRVKR